MNNTKKQRGGSKPKINISKELLEEMYKTMTQKQIAEELGVHDKTIRRRFKEYGIITGVHGGVAIPKKKLNKPKVKPKYQNKENFLKVYQELNSIVLVAKYYNISTDCAYFWKKRHNIETIKGVSEEGKRKLSEGKPYTNKEWLEEKYKTLTQPQIAEICGVNVSTIKEWFKRLDIKTRNPKEQRQIKASYGNKFIFEDRFDKKSYLTVYENEGRITSKMLNYIKDLVGKCQCCGYTEVLDLHHIDENKFNNRPENHLICCPNCHSKIHRLGLKAEDIRKDKTIWIDLVDMPKEKYCEDCIHLKQDEIEEYYSCKILPLTRVPIGTNVDCDLFKKKLKKSYGVGH